MGSFSFAAVSDSFGAREGFRMVAYTVCPARPRFNAVSSPIPLLVPVIITEAIGILLLQDCDSHHQAEAAVYTRQSTALRVVFWEAEYLETPIGMVLNMTPEKRPVRTSISGALQAVGWGGLACGIMDITAAFVVYGSLGLKPIPLLQGIAAGLLGPRSFQGGLATACLGLVCHFVIAFSAAAAFYAASRQLLFLRLHAIASGVLYGIAVYFFMNRIVVPLSGATKFPFSFKMMVIGVVIHIFCVGLPIALCVRRFGN